MYIFSALYAVAHPLVRPSVCHTNEDRPALSATLTVAH